MSESQRSFAQIQNLLQADQMNQNAISNLDQLKDNYAQVKDQESNKIYEGIGDTTGGLLSTKGLDGKVLNKLKKKVITTVGDKVGKTAADALEKSGFKKTAQFVNNIRKTGIKGAIKSAVQDSKEAVQTSVSDAVGGVVDDTSGAIRAEVQTLGNRGRGIANLFRRVKNLNLDNLHDARNPFQALSGDRSRLLQAGGGDQAVPQLDAAVDDLQANALAAGDIDGGVAGAAEGAAAVDPSGVRSIWEAGLFEPDDMDVAAHGGALGAGGEDQVAEQAANVIADDATPAVNAAVDDAASAAAKAAAAAADTVKTLTGVEGGLDATEVALTGVDAVDQEIPGLDVVTDLATLGVGIGALVAGNLIKTKSDEKAQSAQDQLDHSQAMNVTGIGYDMGSK